MSLFRPFPPVISVPDCTPCHLFPVSFITASLSPLPFLPLFHQKGFPLANHRVYHHIKNGGRQWVALGNPSLSAERCTIVTSRPCHHPQSCPILSEEAKGPGAHAITLQDIHAPGPVQGVLNLGQVQEYFMEDRLHQGRNLLNKLNDVSKNIHCKSNDFFPQDDI